MKNSIDLLIQYLNIKYYNLKTIYFEVEKIGERGGISTPEMSALADEH